MRIKTLPRSIAGSTLVTVIVIGAIAGITIASMLSLSSTSLRNAHGRGDRVAAFYHADSLLAWAAQTIVDTETIPGSNFLSTVNGTLSLPYLTAARNDPNSGFKNAWVKIMRTNSAMQNTYLVTVSAKVNEKVRTIQAVIVKNPPNEVFDNEYFLNNWGWWWGNTITGNGANRANWDFDFRYNPVVNGLISANGFITCNGVPVTNLLAGSLPFGGTATLNPVATVHAGAPRVQMPNLKDFTYYEAKALANPATNGIWIGGSQVVFGAQTNASKTGIYLSGTAAKPIVISNTVVIPGDVIIKGKITGQGTLYVGGNLYIANDVTYNNGPTWTTPPETMSATNRDQWVANNQTKDLVGFAVRGTILAGDVNSTTWKTDCFNPSSYGLANVGNESHLGADGIAGTPDDSVPFLHADGTWSTWYDADEDGVVDSAYNYNNDIVMSSTRASKIANYPTNPTNSAILLSYSGQVATNNMNSLDGVFYTNHAAAMRLQKNNGLFHGTLISRDEAVIFNSTLMFVYDSRVHSRYTKDRNKFVDFGLPAWPLRLDGFAELPPDSRSL